MFTAMLGGDKPVAEADIEARLVREIRFDPDVWIVEVEDRAGRNFLDECGELALLYPAALDARGLLDAAAIGPIARRGRKRAGIAPLVVPMDRRVHGRDRRVRLPPDREHAAGGCGREFVEKAGEVVDPRRPIARPPD